MEGYTVRFVSFSDHGYGYFCCLSPEEVVMMRVFLVCLFVFGFSFGFWIWF